MGIRRGKSSITDTEQRMLWNLGTLLQKIRKANKQTQVQVGHRSRVTHPMISMVENGRVPYVSLLTLRRIADSMDADIEVLVIPRRRQT